MHDTITKNLFSASIFYGRGHSLVAMWLVLTCACSAAKVVVNNSFPIIEYLDSKLEPKDENNGEETELDLESGFWYKFNIPNTVDGRTFEFHPLESAYIQLDSLPGYYAFLQNYRMGMTFYQKKETQIEPTWKAVAKENISKSNLEGFLEYLGLEMESDGHTLSRVNRLRLVKVENAEKLKVAKAQDLMAKTEKRIDPNFDKWTCAAYNFDVDSSLKQDFGLNLTKHFLLMAHLKNKDAFYDSSSFVSQVDHQLLDKGDQIAEAILMPDGQKIAQQQLIDEIVDLVKYFHIKGLIWWFFRNRMFLSTWLTSDEITDLRKHTDKLMATGFFYPEAFDTDIYFSLFAEEHDKIEEPETIEGVQAIEHRRILLGQKVKELYTLQLDSIIDKLDSLSPENKPALALLDDEDDQNVFVAAMNLVPNRFKKHAFGPTANSVLLSIILHSGIFDNPTNAIMNDVTAASFLKKVLFLNGLIPLDKSIEPDTQVVEVNFFKLDLGRLII